jgi:hypothetical protein
MTSDPEHPEDGMAEDAKAFEDWEDAFIARNREAIGKLLEEAYEDSRAGRVEEWNLEAFLADARRRHGQASGT